jgi:hypothetical protein
MRLDAAAQLHTGEKYLANAKNWIASSLPYRLIFVKNKIKNLPTHAFKTQEI